MAVVTELVTKFGFSGSLAPLQSFNDKLGAGLGFIGAFSAATITATAAVGKLAANQLTAIEPMRNLSMETGIAVGRLQELDYMAEQSGASAENMRSSIESLTQKIGDAAQKGSADFSRLGISVRDSAGNIKNADAIMGEVRNRFREMGLSMQEQRSFAEALGIDSSLLQLLNKSQSEISALSSRARELGTLTGEQAEDAALFTQKQKEMNFAINAAKNLFAVGLAPQLSAITDGFVDLIAENKDWIVNGLQKTFEVGTAFIDMLVRLSPILTVITAGFVAAKIATLGFSGAIGLVLSPAVLVGAAIAATALIVDDLIVAFQGGESVIADFFESFFGVDIVPFMKNIVHYFVWMKETAISLLTDLFSWIDEKFMAVTGVIGKVGSFLGLDGGQTVNNTGGNSVSQKIDINVNGGDAAVIADNISSALQKQLKLADAQANKGGV